MLGVGKIFPQYNLKSVQGTDIGNAFSEATDADVTGQWKVYFFWPKDFTFICPTEIAAFGKLYQEFKDRDTELFGVSTDSEFVHLAWKQNHPDLTPSPFPWLSDIKRELSTDLGIQTQRFIVSK